MAEETINPIVLFDGYCALCNDSIRFILRHESEVKLRFAPLQTVIGNHFQKKLEKNIKINSIIVIEFINQKEWKFYLRSDATILLAKYLKFPWRLLRYIKFIPKYLRDVSYDFVANNRYRIWGKYDSCRIPTEVDSRRFISEIKDI